MPGRNNRAGRPLVWYGGKARLSDTIAEILPFKKQGAYCEPFCGMASVLLARPQCNQEILGDADERVINWWRAIRDEPEEFERLIQNTPYCRSEHARSQEVVADPDAPPLKRALAFHVLNTQGIYGSGFPFQKDPRARTVVWEKGRVFPLAERLRRVVLWNIPAEEVLDKLRDTEEAVIYCDPPYPGSETKHYVNRGEIDTPRLSELLLAQRGGVAISGYPGNWDHLGWRRIDFAHTFIDWQTCKKVRTECLWINDNIPEPQRRLL